MPELKNIRIALSGIYPYRVDELASLRLPPAPEWAKGKEFYNVYRPAIVLKKAVNLFSNLPLTHNHPQTPVNGDNFRNLALGWTGEKPFIDVVDNEVGIRSTLIMYDDEALTAYNNGEIQLSPGYVGSFSWQHGYAPDGQEYDIIMNNIDSVNHLALLPIGRGGDNAVVLDTGENIPKRKTVFDMVKDFVKDDGENNISIFDFVALRNEIADILEMQAEADDTGALVTDVKYAEGTVRSRKDGDYRKQSGKWVKIYEKEGKGASLAVTAAVKKIKAAQSVDELMDLVNANISRFYDKNGKLLPVVQRLKEAVNESKTRINSAKKEKENQTQESEKPEEKRTVDTNPNIKAIRDKYEASKSVTGYKKTFTLPNGEKIKCHYKIVEADAPTASHNEHTFESSENFPTTPDGRNINDRDYKNDMDARESVLKIAGNFNSLALQDAPIVTKDGVVVSGNNRTMSSKLAAEKGIDKAYIADLKEMADEFGFDEKALDGFKHPRLVLEIDKEHTGDYTTEEFAQYNKDTKKTMNNVEKAVKLTKTLNPQKISSIAESINGYETMGDLYNDKKGGQEFVQKLITAGIIGDNEKAQYLQSDGLLNNSGKDFVETVLVGSVLNENNIRACDSEGGKAIRKKLIRAILPLIENKGNGNEYSFNKELNEAVEIALNVSKSNEWKTIDNYVKQQGLFDETPPDKATVALANLLYNKGEKIFADKMKDLGAGMNESASGQMDMFLSEVYTKQQLLDKFLEIER
jgi:hypothetical protein